MIVERERERQKKDSKCHNIPKTTKAMMKIVNIVSKLFSSFFYSVEFLSLNLSARSWRDDDDDNKERKGKNPIYFKFICKVLQPVSNQYNITDKIKEANQELYKGEKFQRSTQPKVRFRDHQLVDFEPEANESVPAQQQMERRPSVTVSTVNSNSQNNISKIKEEESSDDGYIDEEDEVVAEVEQTRIVVESSSVEIEEVCEQIEILEAASVDIGDEDDDGESDNDDNSANEEEIYTKDDFHEDNNNKDENSAIMTTTVKKKAHKKQKQQPQQALPTSEKKKNSSKKVFRSKVTPSADEIMPTTPTDAPMEISAPSKKSASSRKLCCQMNNEYKQKLPKYNGFSSNYGLSKEELERRSFNQQRYNEIQQSREAKKSEQKKFVAKVNEEAFSKW